MRVAVCISGHLRNFNTGYDYFHETFIKKNPDVEFDFFVSTWDVCDWRTIDKDKQTETIFDEFSKKYKPVKIHIEKNITWDTTKYMPHVHNQRWLKKGYRGVRSDGSHILGMYYKIKKSNDLKQLYEKENKFKYDLVMRHRTDFYFDGNIDLNKILSESNNHIFVPDCDEKSKSEGIPIRDVFAVSSSKNIDFYSNLFDSLDNVIKKYDIFRPEPILFNYLSENNHIKTKEIINRWGICQN